MAPLTFEEEINIGRLSEKKSTQRTELEYTRNQASFFNGEHDT